jgi:hypothetical protein
MLKVVKTRDKYCSCSSCGAGKHLYDLVIYRKNAGISNIICLCYKCVRLIYKSYKEERDATQ